MIDLCVVSYNTQRLLRRFLDVLHADRKVHPDSWRLWVADNGSTDGTPEFLLACCVDHPSYNGSRYEFTGFQNENIGYAAACNRLASYGSADIIGLLNADTWLSTRDVRMIQAAFDEDPTIAILGPKQRNERGHITHAGIVGTSSRPKHQGWMQYDPGDILYRQLTDCVTVSGSAYFIRRAIWDELASCPTYEQFVTEDLACPEVPGAFLPTPMYFEETFLSYHARAHGYRVVYDGRTSIGHTWHGSSPTGSQTHKFRESREIFRRACAAHQIECD